jgi:hypothetical protein
MGRERDSTQSLISDAENLIKNKGKKKDDAPPPTRDLLAGAEKMIKDRPKRDEPAKKKSNAILWIVIGLAGLGAMAFYFMK